MNADKTLSFEGVNVMITRSDEDGAVLVFIDTDNEPDGSDGTKGVRVWLNDGIIFKTKAVEV